MPKHMLRLRDLGQEGFWQLLQALPCSPSATAKVQQGQHKACLCVAKTANVAREDISFWHHSLQSLNFSVEEQELDTHSLEALSIWSQEQTDTALRVALGFTAMQLDIVSQTPGLWINGGGPQSHPMAALAEVALLTEAAAARQMPLDKVRIAWLGKADGLANSLIEAAIYVPFELFMALPPDGDPDHDITGLALKSGAKIFLTREPELAVDGAHFIYMNALATEKEQPQNLSGPGFSWEQGLCLAPSLLQRAAPSALLTSTLAQQAVAGLDQQFATRRNMVREHVACALLKNYIL